MKSSTLLWILGGLAAYLYLSKQQSTPSMVYPLSYVGPLPPGGVYGNVGVITAAANYAGDIFRNVNGSMVPIAGPSNPATANYGLPVDQGTPFNPNTMTDYSAGVTGDPCIDNPGLCDANGNFQ